MSSWSPSVPWLQREWNWPGQPERFRIAMQSQGVAVDSDVLSAAASLSSAQSQLAS